jgi:hypothetical protein
MKRRPRRNHAPAFKAKVALAAINLDRLATRNHGLDHRGCEPGEHKTCQHVTRESVGEHKHLSQAALGGGEDHERTSLIRAEVWFSRGRRHPWPFIDRLEVTALPRALTARRNRCSQRTASASDKPRTGDPDA